MPVRFNEVGKLKRACENFHKPVWIVTKESVRSVPYLTTIP